MSTIDRDALVERLERIKSGAEDAEANFLPSIFDWFIEIVRREPERGCVEKPERSWAPIGNGISMCTGCGHGIRSHMACVSNFRPNCGAPMTKQEGESR